VDPGTGGDPLDERLHAAERAVGDLAELGAQLEVGHDALVVLTIVYHVPRNDALATLEPNDASAVDHWRRHTKTWTAWNHVRTVAPLAAATLLTISLRVS
jgi:hypothetical protein